MDSIFLVAIVAVVCIVAYFYFIKPSTVAGATTVSIVDKNTSAQFTTSIADTTAVPNSTGLPGYTTEATDASDYTISGVNLSMPVEGQPVKYVSVTTATKSPDKVKGGMI